MSLGELLQKNKEAVVRRWLDGILATYSEDASVAFSRQKDPFANPVGHGLRIGTQGIFEALVDGEHADKMHEHLDEIVRLRAVQQFSASEAVAFVFKLKEAVRAELPGAAGDPGLASELAEFERRIDLVALAAFDRFVHYREQVYELRMNETKRQVAWVLGKMNQRKVDPELAEVDLK